MTTASLAILNASVFDGVTTLPGARDVVIDRGVIAAVAPAGTYAHDAAPEVIQGAHVIPGIVDAHVHLAFSTAGAVASRGVTGVLDLGEPLERAFLPHPPLRYRAAGPILTAPGGYPTRSWGAGGFGLEISSPADARRAVAELTARGAAMIKVAIQGEPSLDDETLEAIATRASQESVMTVAHALTHDAVTRATRAGVTALAHTPVEPLGDELVAACGERAMTVVSTVRAFGDAPATHANLEALARAGCTIVYGTDLGNEGIAPGADASELETLAVALGSRDAALAAATTHAGAFAGIGGTRVEERAVANIVVCESDSFDSISRPLRVVIDGSLLDLS